MLNRVSQDRNVFLLIIMMIASGFAAPDAIAAELASPVEFSIPSGSLVEAVIEFSKQAGVQVVVGAENIKHHQSDGLAGVMLPGEALEILLDGVDVQFQYLGEHTIVVYDTPVADAEANAGTAVADMQADSRSVRGRSLHEIIVTAQKQEQLLQDVPIAITVISPEVLANLGIDTFEEMDVPGTQVGAAGRTDNVFIRGVGSGINSGFEQSVPFYIDNTYHGRARVQRLAFLDLGSIEILKGPQPTYFGKNAIGGAIGINSRRPTPEFEGALELTHEFKHEETTIFSMVSGPLSENLQARAAIMYRTLDEGWLKNIAIGSRGEPTQKDLLGRVSLLWSPDDALEVFVKFETANDRWAGRHAQLVNCTPLAPIDPALDDCLFDGETAFTYDPAGFGALGNILSGEIGDTYVSDFDYTGGQISVTWRIADYTFTSASSYFQYDESVFFKADVNSLQIAAADLPEKLDQFSQEFRVLSPRNKHFEWVGGLYFDTNSLFTSNPAVFNTPAGLSGFESRMDTEAAESWAIFGELGFGLSPALTARIGFRYTEVNKQADYSFSTFTTAGPVVVPLTGFNLQATRDESNFQPSVVLEWRPKEDYLLYGSWKRGFKAGGFDHSAQSADRDAFEFESEHVTAYELGAKLSLLNGAATLNLAAFWSEFQDLQVTQFDASSAAFRTLNAAQATSRGVELDVAWAAADHLTLNATLHWLDAKYDRFPGAQCYDNPPQTILQGCFPTGQIDPAGNPILAQDLAGSSLQYAATWSGTFSATYRRPFMQGRSSLPLEFVSRLDLFHTSDFNTNNRGDLDQVQPGYAKVDARVGIAHKNGTWEVALVGRNLGDEFTSHWIQDTPLAGGQSNFALLDRARQLAIQLRANF